MIKKILVCVYIFVFVINCSTSSNKKIAEDNIRNPEEIFISANNYFANENLVLAEEEFNYLIKLYPLSNEAINSEVILGFISYLKMDYDMASLQFDKIITKYPSHKDLDYAYYMKAMCSYEQITHHELDGNFNDLA